MNTNEEEIRKVDSQNNSDLTVSLNTVLVNPNSSSEVNEDEYDILNKNDEILVDEKIENEVKELIETVTASVEENAEKEEEEVKQKKVNIENSDSIKDANKDSFIHLNASIDETKVADEQSKVEEESKKVVDENTRDDDANRESFISVLTESVSLKCEESADNQENKATSNVAEEENSSKEPFVDVIGLKEGLEDAQKSPTEEPFEEVKVEEEVELEEDPILDILGNSSLIKKILKKGAKDQRPKNGQICTISYKTRLEDKIIEDKSSYQFILGDADVVPALDIGVSLMNLNEECELKSESRHAFGEKGDVELKIPPNATLEFNIILEKIENPLDLKTLDTIERLSIADAKKKRGNYYYNRQNYEQALASYRKGLKVFIDHNLNGNESKEDLDKFNDVKAALYMNVALSNYKLQSNNDALEALDNVLKHHNNHVKALFIKGKILFHIGELTEAIKCFKKALEFEDNADIRKELERAQAKHKIQYAKEKEMYQKMISGVGAIPDDLSPSSSTTAKVTNKKKSTTEEKTNNNSSNGSNFFNYLATAGVIVAIASIGIAAYAKYKNLI